MVFLYYNAEEGGSSRAVRRRLTNATLMELPKNDSADLSGRSSSFGRRGRGRAHILGSHDSRQMSLSHARKDLDEPP